MLDAKLGNFLIEGGYQNDNQINDKYFGSVKYVVNFGEDNQSSTPSATSLMMLVINFINP